MSNEEQGRASFDKIISSDIDINISNNCKDDVVTSNINNRSNRGFANTTVLIVVIICVVAFGVYLGYLLSR